MALLLATGFGLGLSPVASGTVGALPGILLVMALCGLPVLWQAVCVVALVALAVPVCGAAEKIYGRKDDGRIVADEYVTLPLCMIGLPVAAHPWLLAVGFVTHRACDVLKPPPARQIQALRGGAGIVMDDVISSLYALGLNHLIYRILSR
jgi:phosphatidylglycerophosphatase A